MVRERFRAAGLQNSSPDLPSEWSGQKNGAAEPDGCMAAQIDLTKSWEPGERKWQRCRTDPQGGL